MNVCRALAILIICTLVISCKSDDQNKIIDSKKENIQSKTETRHQIYLVTVDNLRVRKGDKKSTEVIDKLKEQTIVYSRGETSDHKEKITLRGTSYNEAYQKVTYEGNTGWVYGGGLYKIYDEAEEDSFTETFEGMITQLTSPNKTGLDKGKYIMRGLLKEKSGSEEWNDILYFIAEQQLKILTKNDKLQQLINEQSWTTEDYNSASNLNYNMNSNRFAQSFRQAGMKFSASEGMIEPIIDPFLISKTIEGPFSSSMNDYLDIRKEESSDRFFDDGRITRPISELTSHIIDIEKFIIAYPHFPRNNDLKRELKGLHHALIYGTDNSAAYNPNTKRISEEWLNSWDQYLSMNPNGLIADQIKITKEKHRNK